ncbi:uncharacterized protein BDR25DRAFT_345279 [Lindgomyces ingoldianus]|uniref:Uncharacterized protein n=1 Tax=Lindgomyces ingoldianus TaxID=673940 RepID=A0ACB6QLW4_9PLEO|nr:uncharacterized protein BDR25DRAFT_345279 [Lindgomyces ingoldianus]KAF2467136.1 hypothetical protein BDR25DRAFT_345279 [Lindgomyces ingoldianus]
MHLLTLLSAAILAPMCGLAAPAGDFSATYHVLDKKGDNLCNQYKSPPQLCTPDLTVTVAQTAERAYKFYKAFVVDGDARTMFSLIDNSYIQHHAGYANGPQAIWSLFCNGKPVGTAGNSAWCFDASTNMSYARYSTVDRWRWVGGCVHEHWDSNEKIPTEKCYKLNSTLVA